MKRNNAKMAVIVGGCCAALAVGGALAFLTDTDSVTNRFNVVDALQIDVTEPGWDGLPDEDEDGIPDAAEETTPGETFTKDPRVTNTSGVEAWIFARVDIPVETVRVIEEDGTVSESAATELFSFTKNAKWTQMGDVVMSDDGDTASYWFKYDDKVGVGQSTGTIFDTITYANVVEGELSGNRELDVVVTGYGIQTEGFDTADEAWEAYAEQNKDGVLNGVKLPVIESTALQSVVNRVPSAPVAEDDGAAETPATDEGDKADEVPATELTPAEDIEDAADEGTSEDEDAQESIPAFALTPATPIA